MSIAPDGGMRALLRHELEVLQGNWGWYLALGIALIVLGTLAIATPLLATLVTVTVISVFLVLGGFAQILGAFWSRRWSGFFAHVLVGILYLVVGILMGRHPVSGSAAITLLIAALLIVGGAFRIVAALAMRFPHWGWVLANGVITLLLGVIIWRQWPGSALWVIGLFIGIDMIFSGWTWVMLALSLREMGRVKV